MADIPKETTLDSSLALLRDGFTFIQKRCLEFESDIFQTRLLGQKAICMSGEEAARIFYDADKFKRSGAVPKRVQKTLLGENGIQTMDGEPHRHRKAMFMALVGAMSVQKLADLTVRQWQACIPKWEKIDEVVLFDETQQLLCRAACQWAGVPLAENEVKQRAQDFGAMVDAFGAVGPRHWRGRMARRRGEAWISELIEKVRNGEMSFAEGAPAHVIAWHRDVNGELLDAHMATVELINVVRPIVAIATYITFAALALHEHPETRSKLQQEGDDYAEWFVQEVRRYYPFGPFLGALVKSEFKWRGHRFEEGTLVLLDIYGTNHDARLWDQPGEFRPGRFRTWNGSAFNLIPQGGGDHQTGHRCPGERITIELVKVALRFLTKQMQYTVPGQDLSFSLSRMPTLPESRLVIKNVKGKNYAA